MNDEARRTTGGSWALQGCLFGAVALFAVLLLILVFLAYRQFRANVRPPLDAEDTTTSWVVPPEPQAHG